MQKHVIAFTYELGIARPDTHPLDNNLDVKIRTNLGLNEFDKYIITHTSQSQEAIGKDKMLLTISLIVEVE